MAKDGLGSVADRAKAHRAWAKAFYAGVVPMQQEPRQQWRRRARKGLKRQRIMPDNGVNRTRVSIRAIERANGMTKGFLNPRGCQPHGSEIKFAGLKS